MDPWTLGLVAVVVVGLALIVYGALSDRSKTRRAAVEMLTPPQRDIPHFRPDSPAPTYLSELQARRPAASAVSTDLTAADRAQVAAQLKHPLTVRVDAGYDSLDFVTDPTSGWAVLDSPRVLVCSEGIETTRELLGVLEKLLLSRTPLVIVTPGLSAEVGSTLQVNHIRQNMSLLTVTTSVVADLTRVARVTGAAVKSRSDLQAGYVWPEHLGRCDRWVSSAKASFLIGTLDGSVPG